MLPDCLMFYKNDNALSRKFPLHTRRRYVFKVLSYESYYSYKQFKNVINRVCNFSTHFYFILLFLSSYYLPARRINVSIRSMRLYGVVFTQQYSVIEYENHFCAA
jgi:hypothetical protein